MRKLTYTTPAYWPRSDKRATVNFDDRLEIVYCVWDDPTVVSEFPPHERLNLVFVHGSQCNKEIWTYFAEMAFKKWGSLVNQCIAVDVVTHGDSAVLNHNKLGYIADWDDVARDVGCVIHDCIRRDNISGPIVYVGHSMGGMVGMILSVFETNLLDGLVLLDPIYALNQPVDAWVEAATQLFNKSMRTPDTFENLDKYKDFMYTKFCRRWDPKIKDPFIEAFAFELPDKTVKAKANTANQVSAYVSAGTVLEVTENIIKAVRTPNIVLDSDRDKRPNTCGELSAMLQNSQYAYVPGSGHNFPFELPDATFAAIVPFIENCLDAGKIRRWNNRELSWDQAAKYQYDGIRGVVQSRQDFAKREPKLLSSKVPAKF